MICRVVKIIQIPVFARHKVHLGGNGGSYPLSFVNSLERLASLDIEIIYSGHDDPVTRGAKAMIANTLKNVKKSSLLPN
jgi:glyoxylase-like metal-dependent hydrolase (beta-lactamase superfamily II)